jgi:hypothetical protein
MRKMYFVIAFLASTVSCFALAQHQRNQISLSGDGWNINFGNQFPHQGLHPSRRQNQPILYPQSQRIYYAQQTPFVYYEQPQMRLVQICGPVYGVHTEYGITYRRDCWTEWRYQ